MAPGFFTRWRRGSRQRARIQPGAMHRQAALHWLLQAGRARPGNGLSAHYDRQRQRWQGVSPAVSAYVIPELYTYACQAGQHRYAEVASSLALWLCEQQLPSGSLPAGVLTQKRLSAGLASTGYALLAWAEADSNRQEPRLAAAQSNAAHWLLQNQAPDGVWRGLGTFATADIAVAALGLSHAVRLPDGAAYRQAAWSGLEAVAARQQDNGWFENADPDHQDAAATWYVAVLLDALLEGGMRLGSQSLMAAARKGLERLRQSQWSTGGMAAQFDRDWRVQGQGSDLAATMQLAHAWLLLAHLEQDPEWLTAAEKALDFAQAQQYLSPASVGGHTGAIPAIAPLRRTHRQQESAWATGAFLKAGLLHQRLIGNR